MIAPYYDPNRPNPNVLWDNSNAAPPIILKGWVEKTPDDEPEPIPGPDEPEPEPVPAQSPQVDKAFLLSLFSMLSDTLYSALSKPAFNFPSQPLSLPTRTRIPIPSPEPIPLRPIPTMGPPPSSQLNTTVQNTLQALRTQTENRLQAKLNANQQAAQGRIDIAQRIAGTDTSQPQIIPQQPSPTPVYDIPQISGNPAALQALQNVLSPSAGQSALPIQEDSSWIQANLAHASRPVSMQEQLRAAQNATLMRQQLEAQQVYYREQAELAEAQRQALQLQNWAAYQKAKQPNTLIAASNDIVTDVPDNLLAEAGSVSLRYKAPKFGENAVGPKSNFPPKLIQYQNDQDLSNKLWDHFYNGQGQPVEIDLNKLDFSNEINIPKLFPKKLLQYLSNPNNLKLKNNKNLIEALSGKHLEKGFPASNAKVSHIAFKDTFTDVEPRLEQTISPSKFSAFGRIALNLKNLEFLIDYKSRAVTIQAEIYPSQSPRLFDTFDFDSDPTRGWQWNTATEIIHRNAPPESTSFKIYGKGFSNFKRTYSFQEFFK